MKVSNFLPVLAAIISITLTQAASLFSPPRIHNPAPGIGLISTDYSTYKLMDARVKKFTPELALFKVDAGMS
ncbi:Protein of unknown function [Pyronema omphalodes CBS 100304]|uniref:Uncharacterized protein n=1 Tax=Pyronema omphalodes (strain CBS 100304) TaxID=1076935 RepID=U4L5R3_PYROM|nr:Protein of unknown function [Pyronema omphalodes CBS 100304]